MLGDPIILRSFGIFVRDNFRIAWPPELYTQNHIITLVPPINIESATIPFQYRKLGSRVRRMIFCT